MVLVDTSVWIQHFRRGVPNGRGNTTQGGRTSGAHHRLEIAAELETAASSAEKLNMQ